MNSYWIYYPRGFANEYTLAVAGDPHTQAHLEGLGYDRISRARWIQLARIRHDHAGYIAFLNHYGRSGDIAECISHCAEATAHEFAHPESDDVFLFRLR